jgi:hypothetical protein
LVPSHHSRFVRDRFEPGDGVKDDSVAGGVAVKYLLIPFAGERCRDAFFNNFTVFERLVTIVRSSLSNISPSWRTGKEYGPLLRIATVEHRIEDGTAGRS